MSARDHLDDTAAPLIEHLKELRTRILYAMSAFMVCFVVGYVIWQPIFRFLSRPMCDVMAKRGEQCQLILIKMQEGFFVAIKIAMWGGFALAFPIIAFQLWRFVAPGLYKSEKNALLPFLIASPVMFFIGAAFAYYVVLPMAFAFFLGFQQIGPETTTALTTGAAEVATKAEDAVPGIVFQGSAQEYLGLTMKFVLAFGLCFQLPVLLVLLGKAGIVSSKGLAAMRKYAIVAILVLAAVATPPDVMSQVILFATVYPLYEISVILVRRIEKTREARLRAEGLWDEDEDEDAA